MKHECRTCKKFNPVFRWCAQFDHKVTMTLLECLVWEAKE